MAGSQFFPYHSRTKERGLNFDAAFVFKQDSSFQRLLSALNGLKECLKFSLPILAVLQKFHHQERAPPEDQLQDGASSLDRLLQR